MSLDIYMLLSLTTPIIFVSLIDALYVARKVVFEKLAKSFRFVISLTIYQMISWLLVTVVMILTSGSRVFTLITLIAFLYCLYSVILFQRGNYRRALILSGAYYVLFLIFMVFNLVTNSYTDITNIVQDIMYAAAVYIIIFKLRDYINNNDQATADDSSITN